MDPISMMMGATALVGIGMQLFGTEKSVDYSKQISAVQSQIYGVEQQENYQKYVQMLYQSQRQEIQNLRQVQQVRSASLAAGVSQGAQYGSGVKGGQSAASAEGGFNALGISQAVQTGSALYGLTSQETALNQMRTTIQGNLASAQGVQAFGSALTGASGAIGKLGGQATASNPFNTPFFQSGWGYQ